LKKPARGLFQQVLLPDPPRELPAERAIRTTLRTAHIATAGILLGGHLFEVEPARLVLWLWLTIGTGAAFMAVELYGSFIWLIELRGLLTMLKLALLGAVPLFWAHRVWLLLAALVIGSVGSHMPGRFRYYSFLRRQTVEDERRG
jgi:hypothetical protein